MCCQILSNQNNNEIMKSRKISYIRQNSVQKQKNIFVILTYITLGLLLMFFVINWVLKSSYFIAKDIIKWDITYTVWQNIKLQWEIWEVLGNGILKFTEDGGKIWTIKSKNINLLSYIWNAVIDGTIEWTNIDGTFMIDINRIYQVVENNNDNNLETKFYNVWYGLYVDIDDPNYFVSYLSGEVIIKDIRTFKPSVKITMRWCDESNPNKDCQKIVNNSEKKQFDNFISSNGMKYYKMEDGSWFMDDKNWRWYLMYTSSDQTMFYVTKFIYLLNHNYIRSKIEDVLSTVCKDTENQLKSIDNFEIRYQNNNNFAILKWPSNVEWSYIQCEVLINDNDSTRDIVLESINIIPINHQ